jgi:hypothetical protein
MVINIKKPGFASSDPLGPPCLLSGENFDLYQAIQADVENLLMPKNILDRMTVRDCTDKIWEGLRYKRIEAQLIDAGRPAALAQLLRPIKGYIEVAEQTAKNYFGSDVKKSAEVKKELLEYGITDDLIRAKALAMHVHDLVMCDRLIANRESSRNILYKDHERRQRRAEKANKKALQSKPAPEVPDSSNKVSK